VTSWVSDHGITGRSARSIVTDLTAAATWWSRPSDRAGLTRKCRLPTTWTPCL